MTEVRIKICGVTSPEIAEYAVERGANYVGAVFCKTSPRNVDVKTAASIATAVKKLGAVPVAVFAQADAKEIIAVSDATGITVVQLHGDNPRSALRELPEHLHVIYAVTPSKHSIPVLRPDKDFLLFDGANAGTGQSIDWRNIHAPTGMRFFLAGGLNPRNVFEAVSIVHPFGVDVSSGVETEPGCKSKALIELFCSAVKDV